MNAISLLCGLLLASLITGASVAFADDLDSDGIPDGQDNCLLVANPDQRDTNLDGLGNFCDPDLNGDDSVNFFDLALIKQAFFSGPSSPNWNADADFNGDDVVNFLDLQLMKRLFFGRPGPGKASAWVHFVDSAYSGASTGSVLAPHKTVGAATAVAAAADLIIVAAGLYRENVIVPAEVTLWSPRIGAAIIHGGAARAGGSPAVIVNDGSTIEGFTVAGGYNGIHCMGSAPIIRRNVVRGNYGDAGITGLSGCTALVENNTVLANLGHDGHGPAFGVYTEDAAIVLRNNIVTGNDIGVSAAAETVSEYNLIGGNVTDWAGDSTPGIGTLLHADPGFIDISVDDYRLTATSAARDAGDPADIFNDADGTRNDIGAFDDDGGYQTSLAIQEYFVEAILGAEDTLQGPRFNGVSRLTADPLFWFDPTSFSTVGETDARAILSDAVSKLSAGHFQALFWPLAQAPGGPCDAILISFDVGSFAIVQRRNESGGCEVDGEPLLVGAEIAGGEIHMPPASANGLVGDLGRTLRHEVTHSGGVHHSFRGRHVIEQFAAQRLEDYSDTERAAFELLYSLPVGTTVDTLLEAAVLTRNVLHPFPRIDDMMRWDADLQRWNAATYDPGHPDNEQSWARPNDWIILEGSRLTLRWVNEPRTEERPPDYAHPRVSFGIAEVTADAGRQRCPSPDPVNPCLPNEPTNTFVGSPARMLKVQVPPDAVSGWVVVTARGLESNPVWLEIR